MNEPTGGSGKRPLAVYSIVERKDKNHWFRIGAAFPNRDGSITLYLDALPVGTNRLQVREQRAWEETRPGNVNGSAAATPQAEGT